MSSNALTLSPKMVSRYAPTLLICANSVVGIAASSSHTRQNANIPIDHIKVRAYAPNAIGHPTITLRAM